MKYVCGVCGYVYDEEVEKVPFADLPDSWTCPMCGAPKELFEMEEPKAAAPEAQAAPAAPAPAPAPAPAASASHEAQGAGSAEDGQDGQGPEDFQRLGAGEMAALFSNLQRGCEKQYQAEAAKRFGELAAYFTKRMPEEADPGIGKLAALVKDDMENRYKKLRETAAQAGDRGMLRAIVWGEKVTRMAGALIDRLQKEGPGFLERESLWVCSVCGFMFLGENPPSVCPVCKVPGWKFEKIEDLGRAK